MIPEILQQILKQDGVVAIATLGQAREVAPGIFVG